MARKNYKGAVYDTRYQQHGDRRNPWVRGMWSATLALEYPEFTRKQITAMCNFADTWIALTLGIAKVQAMIDRAQAKKRDKP